MEVCCTMDFTSSAHAAASGAPSRYAPSVSAVPTASQPSPDTVPSPPQRRYNRPPDEDSDSPLELAVSADGRVFTITQPTTTIHRLASLSFMIQNSLVHLDLRDERLFNALADMVHQFQTESIPALSRLRRPLVDEPGVSAQGSRWQDLPVIPLAAYQVYALKVNGLPTRRIFELPEADGPGGVLGLGLHSPSGAGHEPSTWEAFNGYHPRTGNGDGARNAASGGLTPGHTSAATAPPQPRSPQVPEELATTGVIRFSYEGMALADTALALHARTTLFADRLEAERRGPILFLASNPKEHPDNSLAHYLERLERLFGDDNCRYLGQPHGVDVQELLRALDDAACSSQPITLVASREGLMQILTVLESSPLPCHLPERSRVLVVERSPGLPDYGTLETLRDTCVRLMGLERHELVSVLERPALPGQLYTDCHGSAGRCPRPGWHPPAWMRVCALDPETLSPCPPGKLGLLFFVNLVNVERPLALLSDELGYIHPAGGILSCADERFLREENARGPLLRRASVPVPTTTLAQAVDASAPEVDAAPPHERVDAGSAEEEGVAARASGTDDPDDPDSADNTDNADNTDGPSGSPYTLKSPGYESETSHPVEHSEGSGHPELASADAAAQFVVSPLGSPSTALPSQVEELELEPMYPSAVDPTHGSAQGPLLARDSGAQLPLSVEDSAAPDLRADQLLDPHATET